MASLAELLLQLRTRADLSQEALAAAASLSPGMIAHVEGGRRSLSLESIDRISAALRLSEEDRAVLVRARAQASDAMSSNRRTAREILRSQIEELEAEQRALGPGPLFDLDATPETMAKYFEVRSKIERLSDQLGSDEPDLASRIADLEDQVSSLRDEVQLQGQQLADLARVVAGLQGAPQRRARTRAGEGTAG